MSLMLSASSACNNYIRRAITLLHGICTNGQLGGMASAPLKTRRLDLVYLVFFASHIPVMLSAFPCLASV